MCGIAGYFGPKKFTPKKDRIKKCIELMKTRGPDFQSYKIKDFNNATSLMIHSRLSIIDPNKNSHQPMEDKDGIISYNGEIYNYIELIKKYKMLNLKTKSDTEVFLRYLKMNKDIPNKDLDGMWSYAYLNKNEKKLTLCRDWFGEKPLYYLNKDSGLYYGSNINYIIALSKTKNKINEEKLISFLSFGFKSIQSDNKTFDKNIRTIESSSAISIDKNFKVKKFKIWKKNTEKNFISKNYKENKKYLSNLLKTIFERRLRSDFPIACLLSGGIDSSAIVGYAKKKFNKKIQCYSILSRDKNYDESKQINSFCRNMGIKPNYIKMNKIDNNKFLEEIISETNFPLSSISYLAYANLNKAAHDDGHRVILSGLGGDEMFAGYYMHHMSYLNSNIKNKNFDKIYKEWKKFIKPFIRSKILSDLDYFRSEMKKKYSSFHEKNEIQKYMKVKYQADIIEKKYDNNSFRNQLHQDLFCYTVPPHNLSSDQISMHFSIENRSPFLSKEIFDFSNSIPDEHLINNGYGKFILRDALRGIVPKSILNFREKIGFYANIGDFFNINSKDFKERLFQSNLINSYINKDSIIKILKKKYINNIESKFIFSVLNLAILTKSN